MTTYGLKKLLFYAGLGFFIFLLVKPRNKPANDPAAKPPTVDPKTQKANAQAVLSAYASAVRDGNDAQTLDDLNREFQKKYGLRVYRKTSDSRYYVADTNGTDILRA